MARRRVDSWTVLWSSHYIDWIEQQGDLGAPLAVMFGGSHQSFPSFTSFKVQPGDRIYALLVQRRVLHVAARLTVERVIPLADYYTEHLGLAPKDLRLGPSTITRRLTQRHGPLGHRAPYGCVFEAAMGCGTPIRRDRAVPGAVVDAIRYVTKGGERPIKHARDGLIHHVAGLQGGVYRLTPATARTFARRYSR